MTYTHRPAANFSAGKFIAFERGELARRAERKSQFHSRKSRLPCEDRAYRNWLLTLNSSVLADRGRVYRVDFEGIPLNEIELIDEIEHDSPSRKF